MGRRTILKAVNRMAKEQRALTLKNCVIDLNDGTITEYVKDDTNEYTIHEILGEFEGIDGVSLTLRVEDDLLPNATERSDDSN